MSVCNVQTLVTQSRQAGFANLILNDQLAVFNQLLCNFFTGGGATWGVAGQNMVRPLGNVYVLDSFTGLYHKFGATSQFGPLAVSFGDTGYTFATIPD